MARLGELLVAAGQITAAQLDEGLRAQVLYGGRLGTNLVDLFHLDLDVIALALARQHRLPAALGKHFERCDLTVQARLTPALAERWGVVPIGHLADRRDLIAVAGMDPIAAEGKAELARALRCRPEDVIVSVAAELRIRYFLERGYGIVRASRYLRIRRETSHGVPTPPEIDLDSSDVAVEVDVDLDDPGEDPTIARPAVRSATEEDPTEDRQGTAPWPKLEPGDDSRDVELQFEIDPEPPNALVQERRRRFVRTLSDSDDPIADFELTPGTPTPPLEPPIPARAEPPPIAAPAPAPAPVEPPPPRANFGDGTLARIAIRRVGPGSGPSLTTLDDAARAIRRSPTREQVGDLLIKAALAIAGDGLDAVALFVIREPVAIGWKGAVRGAEPRLDEIAVPLDEPCLAARAFRSRGFERATAEHATAIDRRLWTALGGARPQAAVVAVVQISDHPVCLLYAHGAAPRADLATGLAEAASSAFARLLRAAQR